MCLYYIENFQLPSSIEKWQFGGCKQICLFMRFDLVVWSGFEISLDAILSRTFSSTLSKKKVFWTWIIENLQVSWFTTVFVGCIEPSAWGQKVFKASLNLSNRVKWTNYKCLSRRQGFQQRITLFRGQFNQLFGGLFNLFEGILNLFGGNKTSLFGGTISLLFGKMRLNNLRDLLQFTSKVIIA